MRLSPTIKTIILFGALTSLLGVVGYLINGISTAIIFLIFGVLTNIISFWFSDKIALSFSGARELKKEEAPQIFNIVNDLSLKMNIPSPRIYITNSAQPNAFATGRNPKNGVVCVTRGLLNLLREDEVKGVIAHELAHIKSRDILISTIAAVMAGIISSIAQIGIFFGGNDRDRSPIVDLLILILAPLSATLIQLAISRSREFEADYLASKYTNDPKSLADALIKIEQYVKGAPQENINPAFASLYIQNPLRGGFLVEIFSTHPSTIKRVDRLLSYR